MRSLSCCRGKRQFSPQLQPGTCTGSTVIFFQLGQHTMMAMPFITVLLITLLWYVQSLTEILELANFNEVTAHAAALNAKAV